MEYFTNLHLKEAPHVPENYLCPVESTMMVLIKCIQVNMSGDKVPHQNGDRTHRINTLDLHLQKGFWYSAIYNR